MTTVKLKEIIKFEIIRVNFIFKNSFRINLLVFIKSNILDVNSDSV